MTRSPFRPTLLARALAVTAALALLVTGVAIAAGSTLSAVSGKIGSARATIVVSSSGRAVYTLTGDSKTHPECTSTACLGIWPAVTVGKGQKPSKGRGVSGTLSVWSHGGVNQVLLNGRPLYMYAGDTSSRAANGNGIKTFGGTWLVVK